MVYDSSPGRVNLMKMNIYNTFRRAIDGKEKQTDKHGFYDIEDVDYRKQKVSLSKFNGDVLLVINVANK